jgi:hypothetical protein
MYKIKVISDSQALHINQYKNTKKTLLNCKAKIIVLTLNTDNKKHYLWFTVYFDIICNYHKGMHRTKVIERNIWKLRCSSKYLSFLVWPLLPTHCRCRVLLLHFITLNDTLTLGTTPLDEGSARRRDLYLTTHNIHKRQTSMPPEGFEPAIPARERPQTHALDRAATGKFKPKELVSISCLRTY